VNSKKLDSVQMLRGVAVLLVMAFHFRQYLNNVYPQVDLGDRLFGLGEVGVDIFFVISGFIITYSTINKERNTPAEFVIKRFFRLYPVFIITLLFLVAFDATLKVDAHRFIKSVLIIPNDYNFIGPWYGYNINLPAWTLTYEVLFYALFGLAISISHKYRTFLAIIIIIISCSAAQLYFRGYLQLDPITRDASSDSFARNFTFISNPIIYDFIYGMLISEAYVRIDQDKMDNIFIRVMLVSVCLISLALILSGYNRGAGVERWGFYSFMLVGSLVLLSKMKEINCGRFWVFTGEMSYSLYINHMIVKKLSGIYLRDFGIYKANGGMTLFLILFILTFAMSYITYHLIEKPSVKIGHALAERIRLRRKSPH